MSSKGECLKWSSTAFFIFQQKKYSLDTILYIERAFNNVELGAISGTLARLGIQQEL